MAISYVGGQTAGRAGATSTSAVTFSFTGGTNATPIEGDLVVVTIVVGSQARNPSQDISAQGYTVLTQLNPATSTYDTSMVTAYKRMGSTPDTTVTMPSTGNIADAQRWTIQCFRGVDATTPMDATPVAASGSAVRAQPNPGAITPVTAGAWVVICGGGAAATGVNYTAPTNFTTNFLTGFTVDTNDAQIGSGYWTGWTSGAVDPGVYGGGSTTSVDSWAAYTLALRPQLAVTHGTTGDLTGQGSDVTGSASRFRAFATSGVLAGSGATVSGSADRQDAPVFVTHDTSGTLSGQGASVSGSAARFRAHAATGTLAGQNATANGTARHNIPHATTGTLAGQGAAISGASARFRAHASSGALFSQGVVVAGDALHSSGPVTHDASGAISGQSSAVAGSSSRFRTFSAAGSLSGQGSAVDGSASHILGPVTHDAGGAIFGQASVISGSADHSITITLSEAAILAIAQAVWARQLPLSDAPSVAYGSTGLNAADLDAISHAVWSRSL